MMGNRNAFARAIAMFAAVRAALSITSPSLRQLALSDIGPYRSRGHGRGNVTYARGRGSRGGNNAGRGIPHQGPREMAKRARNLRRGLQSYGTIKLAHERNP